jgi:hypothetical protein
LIDVTFGLSNFARQFLPQLRPRHLRQAKEPPWQRCSEIGTTNVQPNVPRFRRRSFSGKDLRRARVHVGGVELELIEASEPERTMQRFLPHKGPGMYHFGLRVADVDAVIQDCISRGVPLIDRVPRQGGSMRVSFLHPDAAAGLLVELVHASAVACVKRGHVGVARFAAAADGLLWF